VSRPDPRRWAAGAGALGCGALVALSLPPWGWWPLAFVGIALLDPLVADQPRAVRWRRGWLFAAGWLAPGMGWMWFLTAPGYLVATVIYASYIGTAFAVAPSSRWRWLAVPAAVAVAEAIRFAFPFGGVPLASLAISQVAGPLAPLARVGGAVLLTGVTLALGFTLAALARRDVRWSRGLLVAAVVLLVGAVAAPSGRTVGTLDVAVVQGGGPQGTTFVEGGQAEAARVFQRHLDATRTIQGPVDLVVWPENVINMAVGVFEGSPEEAAVAAEAVRLGAPIAVGIVEDSEDGSRFLNAQVVVDPATGTVVSRYDKVRRVPFGEYMPFRGTLASLGAPTNLVPRDAVAGTGPAVVAVPGIGDVGVVISWEVFFGGRGRDAAGNGGRLVINPTNGSSYTGTVLQTQQVASSRLRAIETGRWVVQAAPTGFSAFIAPKAGTVFDRTGVSEQRVIQRTVELREGDTLYVQLGERPWMALGALLVVLAVVMDRRDRSVTPRPAASPAHR
jgi:apolipoprotein N-acyltransferase